jgi:hypothetical protein
VRAARETTRPTVPLVKLVQPDQQLMRGCMEMRRKFGDLVAESLEIPFAR